MTIDALLDVSMRATHHRQDLERLLRRFEPGTDNGRRVYELLVQAEQAEKDARAAVRSHPDHRYDGL